MAVVPLAVFFSTPLAALATAVGAASIPVLIHLLNRRRYRVVDWGAMRFLQAAIKRSVRRLRLEHWLLLAVRLLLILLPVLAMAAITPWAESWWERIIPSGASGPRFAGRTHHIMVLDASLSMTAQRDDGEAFERARALATKLVKNSAGGDGFTIITMSAPSRAVVPGPANDPNRVAREIADLRCAHGLANVAQSLQLAVDTVVRPGGGYARKVVYLFTDLQRSQWATPSSANAAWTEIWQRLHSHAEVAVIDVHGETTANLAVTSVALADSMITANSRSYLTATVQNFGTQDRKQLRVEFLQAKTATAGQLEKGDEPFGARVIRQELIDLPAGASTAVAAPVEFRSAGDYRLEVRLEADSLPADDWRATTITVRDQVPVLLVNGRPAADPFETASGWLSAALDPFHEGTRPTGYPARPKTVLENRLDDPDLDLNGFDCIYLCDVARLAPRSRDRLDTYVRRGGTLIVGLGPSVDAESYQRLLYRDGDGILPARLIRRERAGDGQFFSITTEDDAFRRPPFAAFAADDDRAAILSARFSEYWKLELSPKLPARRLMTFATSTTAGDPLLVEWSVGRGRTILFASTLNTQWTGWPIAPSFPPFVQELLRYSARPAPRRDLIVGDAIDELLSERTAATEALVTLPNGSTQTVPIITGDDLPHLHFAATQQSGLYSFSIASQPPRVFAVNLPAGSESDLQRVGSTDLPATGLGADPTIVTDPTRVPYRPPNAVDDQSVPMVAMTGVLGTAVARWLLLAALALLFVEPILAWRFGSARGTTEAIDGPPDTPARRRRDRWLAFLAVLPLTLVMLGAAIVLHAAITGELLEFLPSSLRTSVERMLGVPPPAAGEGTRWRLDRLPALANDPLTDRWLIGTAAVGALALCIFLYVKELKRSSWLAGLPLVGLRVGLVLLSLFVLLPQLRLVFEREGWPDVVVLIDDSQSMGVADRLEDSTQRKTATELTGVAEPTRLQLVQALLGPGKRDLLSKLSVDRQARLHVFHVSDRLARLAECDSPNELPTAAKVVGDLKATGPSSHLGDAVRNVLEEFRGSSLANVVIFTDGVTTDGEELSSAASHAARAGVSLTLVGFGDIREPNDLILSEVRVDDVIHVGDRLVFEARLAARGELSGVVPVVLSEKQGDRLTELTRQDVMIDPTGAPAKVRLIHAPREPGEHNYVLEVAARPGETDVANNRLERSVYVAEFKRTRVLFIEGRPRYDYQFAKTLLERETEVVRGNKSIDLKVLLTDADLDYSRQDRSALESFPSSREELFNRFDVVILGDVDPHHPLLGEKRLQWLADFVRERGGGMLFLCGPRSMPRAYRGTPLADVLPIDPAAVEAGGTVRPTGYKPRLSTNGRAHPVLRFAPDEQENLEVWNRLKPFFWAATGLSPKPAAEVLATLPPLDGTRDGEPLILQQFVGAGRVLLLGFDESWRWRFRSDAPRFNQFWIQMVRFLARTRPSRPEVRLDRQTPYRRGEPIRVTVHFPDDKPSPSNDAKVNVTLERTPNNGAVERQVIQLAPLAGARGTFETIVPRTPEGHYLFTLTGTETGPGRPPSAEARVLPPPGEMDRLRMNRADMVRAAQISRGRFYTLADVDRLLDELPPVPHVTLNQPRPPWPIWNSAFIVLLGLALAGGEWVLRKRQQLL